MWSVSRTPGGSPPFIAVDRKRGMWGINVAATRERLAIPTFFDRSYLFARDPSGLATVPVGPEPGPTFGCNWVAVHPGGSEIAVTHDDARIRVRDAETGRLLRTLGPDTGSLCMGAAFHPNRPQLATIDFYGEALIYDYESGKVVWRQDLGMGPGIAVDWSPCGRFVAFGGYSWRGRLATMGPDGVPIAIAELGACARGVWKSVAFAGSSRLLVASGDGALLVYERVGDVWAATPAIRGTPPMELANGVAASADERLAYVVSRDQSLRAFDLASRSEVACGLAHVRGVKSVHASSCGRWVVTGAYDRTVLVWSARDLSVELPPIRLANSGISSVRSHGGRVYACSFDGVVFAADAESGRVLWSRTAADASEGV